MSGAACVRRACVAAVMNKAAGQCRQLRNEDQVAPRLVYSLCSLTGLPFRLKVVCHCMMQPVSCKHLSWEHASSLHYSKRAVLLLL